MEYASTDTLDSIAVRRQAEVRKIRLAFVKYGGLVNCGGEKLLMRLALALDKTRFHVMYFWCHPGPDFPYETRLEFRDQLEAAGIPTVEFRVGRRNMRDQIHPWVNTDFFEVFHEDDFDIVQTMRHGDPEFPFMYIPKPVVEWNLFGGIDRSLNIVGTICNCPWLLERWIAEGGDPRRGIAGYPGIEPSLTAENLREELSIPTDAIVVGLHQRADDAIFSPIPLQAFRNVAKQVNADLRFVLMAGSKRYREQAAELGIDICFLPETAEWERICRFLNTLDIYGHGRADGEIHSTAIEEAMLHGLPVVSHKALVGENNAHVDQVQGCGTVCDTAEEYEEFLHRLIMDKDLRLRLGSRGKQRAESEYLMSAIAKRVEALYLQVFHEYCTPKFLRRLRSLPRSHRRWREIRTVQRRIFFAMITPVRQLYHSDLMPARLREGIRGVRRIVRKYKGW